MLSPPPEARVEMARLYVEEGLPVRDIAQRLYWSYGAVYRALAIEGVQMRPNSTQRPSLTEDDFTRVTEMYLSGASAREIGDSLGLSAGAVEYRLDRIGIARRTKADSQRIKRLRELESHGRDALTERQALALGCVERLTGDTEDYVPGVTGDWVLGVTVAKYLGWTHLSCRSALYRLRDFGLLASKRAKHPGSKGRHLLWRRTDVAVVDVLREAMRTVYRSGWQDVQIPVAPLREWINDQVAKERRAYMHSVVTSDYRSTDAANSNVPMAAITARLGVDPRRVYAILNEQRTISLSLADTILTNANGPQLEDLWPELDREARAA